MLISTLHYNITEKLCVFACLKNLFFETRRSPRDLTLPSVQYRIYRFHRRFGSEQNAYDNVHVVITFALLPHVTLWCRRYRSRVAAPPSTSDVVYFVIGPYPARIKVQQCSTLGNFVHFHPSVAYGIMPESRRRGLTRRSSTPNKLSFSMRHLSDDAFPTFRGPDSNLDSRVSQ